jgi:hypothetical protein
MMTFYGLRQGRLVRLDHVSTSGPPLPASTDVLWIDLFDPSRDDERAVETLLGMAVPTREEMAEIEESARLYQERGAVVMTAVVINGMAEGKPSRTQVTFVLTQTFAVTFLVNVPLNEALAGANPTSDTAANIWANYYGPWTIWNHVRAVCASLAFGLFAAAACSLPTALVRGSLLDLAPELWMAMMKSAKRSARLTIDVFGSRSARAKPYASERALGNAYAPPNTVCRHALEVTAPKNAAVKRHVCHAYQNKMRNDSAHRKQSCAIKGPAPSPGGFRRNTQRPCKDPEISDEQPDKHGTKAVRRPGGIEQKKTRECEQGRRDGE